MVIKVVCTCCLIFLYACSVVGDRIAPGVNPNLYQNQPPPHNHQPVNPNQYAPPHQHAPVNVQGQVPKVQMPHESVEVPHHPGPVPRAPQMQQHPQTVQMPAQPNVHQTVPSHQVPVQPNVAHQIPQQGHMPQAHPSSGGNAPNHAGQFQHQQPINPEVAGHHHHSGQQPQVLNANLKEEKEHIGEHFDVPIDTSKMTEQELQFHYFKMHDSDGNNKLDGCELIKSLIHWHEQGRNNPNADTNAPQPKIFTDEELANLIDPILEMDDLDKDGYIDYAEFIHAQNKGTVKEEL